MVPRGLEARCACEDKCVMSCRKSNSLNKGRWSSEDWYLFVNFCYLSSWILITRSRYADRNVSSLECRQTTWTLFFHIVKQACRNVNYSYLCFSVSLYGIFHWTHTHGVLFIYFHAIHWIHVYTYLYNSASSSLSLASYTQLHLAYLHLWNLWPWVCWVFTFFLLFFLNLYWKKAMYRQRQDDGDNGNLHEEN